MRKVTGKQMKTVWTMQAPGKDEKQFGKHPTQKPVGLLRKLIPNSTKIHEYIYDPFLGSGSTAIACEHLGRRCIGIDIDPEYVATSIARLEKLTGKVAEKVWTMKP